MTPSAFAAGLASYLDIMLAARRERQELDRTRTVFGRVRGETS
ncbi:hypothetical protein GCM10008171_32460 [Methylopila jiangsuensis]|uniref:Uncharacterized protein n=1 Tax=Methylopila jiangsuensis TaxID=586230 RepID=A0A9W6JJ67_9HYPH|nr:hypothetical protein [Methylopila jiangsuensis]MDR6284619.1 hypothetical protein [Methylopila jiangsuensis]GLK77992.1 hypothetical protein GCM10008171_32460 [Methylopila jiangsuensis]